MSGRGDNIGRIQAWEPHGTAQTAAINNEPQTESSFRECSPEERRDVSSRGSKAKLVSQLTVTMRSSRGSDQMLTQNPFVTQQLENSAFLNMLDNSSTLSKD